MKKQSSHHVILSNIVGQLRGGEIMGVVNIIFGLSLLTLGRKIFWLFVGCVGFVAGFTYSQELFAVQSELVILAIGVIAGLIAALIAVFLQGVAIALAGFMGGGYIAINIMGMLGLETFQPIWLPYLIGGIIGAILLFLIFDWALIFLSSLIGAGLIVQVTEFSPWLENLIFIALVIFGAMIQISLLRKEPKERET